MVLYADVLVVLNYVVNFLLLLCCEKISGVPQKRKQTMLGALFGGICALAIFLPAMGAVGAVAIRMGTAMGMLLLAYPRRKIRDYLRLGAILLIISFIFAGTVLAICLLVPQDHISYYNGVVYAHLSPLALLVTTTTAYLLVGVFRRMFGRSQRGETMLKVRITRGERTVTLNMLEDTGNSLTEPFSGLPAVVCPYGAVEFLLSPQERKWCKGEMIAEELPAGFRLIHYHAVGGEGLLGAFRPDCFELMGSDGNVRDCMAYVGVSGGEMPGCDGVLNPQIMRQRI